MKKTAFNIAAVVLSVIMLVPVLLIFVNAFSDSSAAWSLIVEDIADILPMFFNSLCCAVLSSLLQTIISVFGGYMLTLKAKRMKTLFLPLVLIMLIPFQVSFLPIYILMKNIGLYGSVFSVIIVESLNPMGILFFSLYLKQIPDTYFDIIKLNSNKKQDVLRYIIYPYSKKAAVFYFIVYFCKVWATSEISDKLIGAAGDTTLVSYISMSYLSSPYVFQLCLLTLVPVFFGGIFIALFVRSEKT